MEIYILLSDEFVEFSTSIKELHQRKKDMNAEFLILYQKHKASMKELDDEAVRFQTKFEEWKHSKKSNVIPAQLPKDAS